MTIQVKHSKVSTIPDTDDTSLVRPSDWNADHTLVGTIDVPNGGTGASTLTGYVKGNGTSAMTASATIPSGDVTGLGTMSTQNANAVAITGGTINGTTIGATSATTVNATTLSGQTGVLRGTGQNLIRYSEDLSNAVWVATSTTVATNTTTAPDGTLTADTLTATAPNATFQQTYSGVTGQVYTVSFYVKRKTGTGTISIRAVENLNTTIAVTTDWQRFSVTATSTSSTIRAGIAITTSGDEVFVWGGQVEFASSAGTYVQTVASTIYGTPTLSFSGVSTLGLESNGALFLQPAGTGAIQAQATTSTTAGGNVRGANAVDFQTFTRGAASQVASGLASSILGGARNTSNSVASVVVCGTDNTAGANSSFVGAGTTNTANGTSNAIVSGLNNSTSGTFAFIGAGQANTAAGYHNFIGGGQTNSGTASAAVTTQSGTMNGTTAVTLSGSNANIKVGQLITGTSIVTASGTTPFTYVAAISGTSLTLSQAASGSSTSTLSFFTPHGVVVGGGNNQATGSYSFIGGGGDAGTAANRNVASGDWSSVLGGFKNTASGIYSFVGGGATNFATSFSSVVCGGGAYATGGFVGNSATSLSSFVGAGVGNTASGSYSFISAGTFGNTRGIDSYHVFPANNNAFGLSAQGVSQSGLLLLARQTTDATPTALTSNTVAAGTTNQVILPNNSAYFFTGEVISGVTGGGNTKGWTIEGVIKRGANAASTALVGTPTVTSMYADVGAATWAIAVTADTTNGGIRVTFTGQASTTIRTVCQIRTTEMTY